jgi:16S rRNA processing protein RimM
MKRPDYLAIGYVRRAHGVRGMLQIEPLTDNPDRFRTLDTVRIESDAGISLMAIETCSEFGGGWLIKLKGVDTRDDAEKLRGAYLTISSDDLPDPGENSFYEFDLVGLKVYTLRGERLGTLIDVRRYPANDIYIVESDRGKLMLPATVEVIKKVDIKNSRMEVELLEGLDFE